MPPAACRGARGARCGPGCRGIFRRRGRRLGLEKCAVRLLLAIEPSLSIELAPDDIQAQKGLARPRVIGQGRERRSLLERIVSHLWAGAYRAQPDGEGQVRVLHGGRRVAAVTGPRTAGLLQLLPSEAQAVTVLWMRCSGLAAYLSAAPPLPSTASIRGLGERLRAALADQQIAVDRSRTSVAARPREGGRGTADHRGRFEEGRGRRVGTGAGV